MQPNLNFQAPREPPDLSDAAVRLRLTPVASKAITRIAEFWNLSASDACQLLGGVSERSWYRLKDSQISSLSQDTLMRISALVGIYKGLQLLFSEPLVSTWVARPNAHPLFRKERPIDMMIRGGIPAMLRVRGYIDALRGGL